MKMRLDQVWRPNQQYHRYTVWRDSCAGLISIKLSLSNMAVSIQMSPSDTRNDQLPATNTVVFS